MSQLFKKINKHLKVYLLRSQFSKIFKTKSKSGL